MPSPLFNQLGPRMPNNNMMQTLMEFKRLFTGDPKQVVQNMLNSGRISQAQINQYAQQADQIYKQMRNMR